MNFLFAIILNNLLFYKVQKSVNSKIIILNFFAGKKEIAIDMYKKGIIELEKGIAIDVGSGQGTFVKIITMFSFIPSTF